MFDRKRLALAGSVALLVVAFHSAVGVAADRPVRYDGYSEVRVMVKTDAQLDAIERMGVRVKNCNIGRGPLDVIATPMQIERLSRLGLEMQLRIPDVQRAIDLQRTENAQRVAALSTGNPFDDFFLDYRPYDGPNGVVWFMNELVARYPTLASMVNVGTTLEGRPIWGMRVTNTATSSKPGVLYFGCEHAREWISTTVPTYFANYLLSRYGFDASVTDLVDHVEFYLLPVFNVDGYEYTLTTDRYWRKNRRDNGNGTRGVDLNRNWSVGWGGPGSSGSGNNETYRGTAPFSEPETQVLRDFFIAHSSVRAQLDIHSYSQLILWPFGYAPTLPPDQETYSDIGADLQTLIMGVHGTPFTPGPMNTTNYPASGVSIDWTYAERGILSFSFELRDTGFYGFTLPADQIVSSNEELVPALLRVANADWVRAPLRLNFPDGVPDRLTAGQETVIIVEAAPQSETVVPGSVRLHYRSRGAGPFADATVTVIGENVFRAVLPAMNCSATPDFYFTARGSGGSLVSSPNGAPDQGDYSARVVTGTAAFFAESLDTNPGWSAEGQWAWGMPTGGGGEEGGFPDPTAGYTGMSVYGYNLDGDYANSLPEQHLTSTPIDCSGRSGVRMSFERWLNVEEPAWDHASVCVSNDGINWVTVWQNGARVADSTWSHQEFDISAIADNHPTVFLRWTMGPTDSTIRLSGWNIDDIRLTGEECSLLPGDYNGDGVVGWSDYEALTACFTGPGGIVGAACVAFDLDADGDVDCADWSDFRAAWTDPSPPPALTACVQWVAPAAVGEGARYVAVTPLPSADPVALHVTSPDQPCLSAFVDFDPRPTLADAGIAKLVSSPVFRTPSAWGTVHVADPRIVPGRRYLFRAEFGGDNVSIYAEATTLVWGDVAEPFGVVNFTDVSAVIDRFRDIPQALPVVRCDLQPATPDYLVDFDDVAITVAAFLGQPYPFGAPADCP